MIAVVDYGAGNLFSVKNALDALGARSVVTADPEVLRQAGGILLPGVGAFPDAMAMLKEKDLVDVLKEEAEKKPFLGICLGMQLLFERSYEFGETQGLGLLPGTVRKIECGDLKIPHMGWNDLKAPCPCAMTEGMEPETYVYFVHSFRAETPKEYISCYTVYGEEIPALVHRDFVYGAQFHPEKSGRAGLHMLKNFVRLTEQ